MPKFADFFAGIGLVTLALEKQGWEAAWLNDVDDKKKEMCLRFMPGSPYRLDDVRNVKGTEVPAVDLAHASFPCVDLSLAGNRNGLNGNESALVREYLRILREMAAIGRLPMLVTLENVPGWLTSAKGADLREVLSELGSLGYRHDVILLDAAHFTPQSRPRVYVVARLGGTALMSTPETDLRPSALRPRLIADFVNRHRDLQWGMLDWPEPPPVRRDLASILENLKDGDPAWWSPDRITYLLGQMKPTHRAAVQSATEGETAKPFTVYRRMRGGRSTAEVRGDGIAGCLRTPRGGSSRQILVLAGRGRIRARLFTSRECARLQGVPEGLSVDGVPYNQSLWGFGDAVCVLAVEWIAVHALNSLVHEGHGHKEEDIASASRRGGEARLDR